VNLAEFGLYYKKICYLKNSTKEAEMELTLKPRVAGVLIIVTGSIVILGMLILAFLVWAFSEGMAVGFGQPSNAPLGIILVLGLVAAVPGVVAVIGGVSALNRRQWGLALAGAICACLYFNVLGIPALVLLILSKNELAARQPEIKKNE
jgi:hypothetical protein